MRYELANLAGVMTLPDTLTFLLKAVASFPAVFRARNLAPIDWQMAGTYELRYRGSRFILPVGQIDQILAGTGDSPTFGAIRELFGADVYLRPFRRLPTSKVAVDLGANRGITTLLLAIALDAPVVVGVEPEAVYAPVVDLLLRENGLEPNRFLRKRAIAASTDGDGKLSVNAILRELDDSEVGLIKIDVEGAEYDLFSANTEWLDRCSNVSMEVHREHGEPRRLERVLLDKGFATIASDQFGQSLSIDHPDTTYLYASRTGALGHGAPGSEVDLSG